MISFRVAPVHPSILSGYLVSPLSNNSSFDFSPKEDVPSGSQSRACQAGTGKRRPKPVKLTDMVRHRPRYVENANLCVTIVQKMLMYISAPRFFALHTRVPKHSGTQAQTLILDVFLKTLRVFLPALSSAPGS